MPDGFDPHPYVPMIERIVLVSFGAERFCWQARGKPFSDGFPDEAAALLWAINRGYAVRRKGKRIIGIWRKQPLLPRRPGAV